MTPAPPPPDLSEQPRTAAGQEFMRLFADLSEGIAEASGSVLDVDATREMVLAIEAEATAVPAADAWQAGYEACWNRLNDAGRLLPSDGATAAVPLDVEQIERGNWPGAVSDGLTLPCSDCGEVPRFDYHVTEEFWRQWVPGRERLGVVCLPCLDGRSGGVGLAAALEGVQWTGTGHTVVLAPLRRYEYARLASADEEGGTT